MSTVIGNNIYRLRVARGWSQEQLGKMIGKTRAAISQYESGETMPRMGVVEDLASAFRVRKSELVDEKVHHARPTSQLDADISELMDIYLSVTDEGRKQLMTFARGVKATYPKNSQNLETA